jgi:hypothetical protein
MTRMVISLKSWNCRFNESIVKEKEVNTLIIVHIENGATRHRFLFSLSDGRKRADPIFKKPGSPGLVLGIQLLP